jgi:hypothetical protein
MVGEHNKRLLYELLYQNVYRMIIISDASIVILQEDYNLGINDLEVRLGWIRL